MVRDHHQSGDHSKELPVAQIWHLLINLKFY